MVRSLHYAFALALLALPTCMQTTESPAVLVVDLDEVSFQPPAGLHVAFTVRNFSSRVEEIPACVGQTSPVLERRVGAEWQVVGGGICLAIFTQVPVPIEPGGHISGSLALVGVGAGTYRLAFSFAPPSAEDVVSEPFSLP